MVENLERLQEHIEVTRQAHHSLQNNCYLHDGVLSQVNYSISLLRRANNSLERAIREAQDDN